VRGRTSAQASALGSPGGTSTSANNGSAAAASGAPGEKAVSGPPPALMAISTSNSAADVPTLPAPVDVPCSSEMLKVASYICRPQASSSRPPAPASPTVPRAAAACAAHRPRRSEMQDDGVILVGVILVGVVLVGCRAATREQAARATKGLKAGTPSDDVSWRLPHQLRIMSRAAQLTKH